MAMYEHIERKALKVVTKHDQTDYLRYPECLHHSQTLQASHTIESMKQVY